MRGEAFPEPRLPPEALRGRWLILWDGECGFCRRTVEWTLRRDRAGVLAALPFQQAEGWLPEPVRALSERQAHLRSPEGRYWGGGDAVIRLLGMLGHPRWERWLARPPGRMLVAWGYRAVARQRGTLGRWLARAGR